MFDKSKLCYLTEDELKTIDNWIKKNSYTLSKGYFQLQFGFSPLDDSVVLCYRQGEKSYDLDVYYWDREYLPRTVNHIVIDGFTVNLNLSDEALEKYFRLGRECTEAHINEDSEPPGFGLYFEIHNKTCNVFAGRQLIETR